MDGLSRTPPSSRFRGGVEIPAYRGYGVDCHGFAGSTRAFVVVGLSGAACAFVIIALSGAAALAAGRPAAFAGALL